MMEYKNIEAEEALRETLNARISAAAEDDRVESKISVMKILRQCMIDGLMFYVPIEKRPITADTNGYNELYKYVDLETENNLSYIIRPVCDPQIDSFMAFVFEEDLRETFPDSPYMGINLTDLCQKLMEADTIEGLRIMSTDLTFVVTTDGLISLSIMAHIPCRGHDE